LAEVHTAGLVVADVEDARVAERVPVLMLVQPPSIGAPSPLASMMSFSAVMTLPLPW